MPDRSTEQAGDELLAVVALPERQALHAAVA